MNNPARRQDATPRPVRLDQERLRRYRFTDAAYTVTLLGGMAGLLSALGWSLAGNTGLVWTLAAGGFLILVGQQIPVWVILRMHRARELDPIAMPWIYDVVAELARRAELPFLPRVFYIPSRVMNAFALRHGHGALVAVTDGLLHGLTPREVVGVLGHEMSHIRHNDTWIMSLADLVGRLTRGMSTGGLVLVMFNVPLVLFGANHVPWPFVILLLVSPTLSALLQRALARVREFAADTEAATLTGDPKGLASALRRLESSQEGSWEQILMRRMSHRSLLRTHPPTDERVRRLLELTPTHLPPTLPPHHWRALPARLS